MDLLIKISLIRCKIAVKQYEDLIDSESLKRLKKHARSILGRNFYPFYSFEDLGPILYSPGIMIRSWGKVPELMSDFGPAFGIKMILLSLVISKYLIDTNPKFEDKSLDISRAAKAIEPYIYYFGEGSGDYLQDLSKEEWGRYTERREDVISELRKHLPKREKEKKPIPESLKPRIPSAPIPQVLERKIPPPPPAIASLLKRIKLLRRY